MKIQVNLVNDPSVYVSIASYILWCLPAALLILSICLVANTINDRASIPGLQKQLLELEEKGSAVAFDQSLPSREELSALKQRVQVFNELLGDSGMSSIAVMSSMERLLPDTAYFLSFRHSRKLREVYIVAESTSSEALTAFLSRLEAEQKFDEVLLTNQSRRTLDTRKVTQFEIKLKERVI